MCLIEYYLINRMSKLEVDYEFFISEATIKEVNGLLEVNFVCDSNTNPYMDIVQTIKQDYTVLLKNNHQEFLFHNVNFSNFSCDTWENTTQARFRGKMYAKLCTSTRT